MLIPSQNKLTSGTLSAEGMLMNWTKIFLLLFVLSASSCLKIPLEIAPSEEIVISKKDVAEISKHLFDALWDLDFSHPPGSPATVSPDVCLSAYRPWLKKSFAWGYLLRGQVPPAVYARSSNDPNIHECRTIDFDAEYTKAVEEYQKSGNRSVKVFNLDEVSNKLTEHKCLDPFRDPDTNKVIIQEMNFDIIKNTLSFSLPTTDLYTSEHKITAEMIPDNEKLQALKAADHIIQLASTRSIPAGATGITSAVFAKDKYYAEPPLIKLSGSIVVVPTSMIDKPEVVNYQGKEYYVLPKGELRIRVRLILSAFSHFSDAKCFYNAFMDQIREEDNERKRIFDERQRKEE